MLLRGWELGGGEEVGTGASQPSTAADGSGTVDVNTDVNADGINRPCCCLEAAIQYRTSREGVWQLWNIGSKLRIVPGTFVLIISTE
jgi:hypothetical protein